MWRAAEKFSPRDVECESTKAERSGMSSYGVAHADVAQSRLVAGWRGRLAPLMGVCVPISARTT